MANQDNLIVPPVLGNISLPDRNPHPDPAPALQQNEELENMIRNVVAQMLNSERSDIIHNVIRTAAKQVPVVDTTIEERHRNNLSEIDKIPDS